MSTHNPLISNFLANSFCPPYSLRWKGLITSSQSRQGNQRVLSPGRWFSSGFIAHVWPGNSRCRLNRVSHCKNTPRPLRGVSIPFNISLSLRWSMAPTPLSCRVMDGCSGSFLFFPAPSSAFSSTYQFNPTTTPSSFAFSPVRPFSQPIFKPDNLEAARLLPALSLPPLSSPFTASLWLLKCFFLSLPAGGGLIGRGAWGREGGTTPFSFSCRPREVSTLAGFPPSLFWTHRLVFH